LPEADDQVIDERLVDYHMAVLTDLSDEALHFLSLSDASEAATSDDPVDGLMQQPVSADLVDQLFASEE
jgi:hypothetical protein